MSHIEKQDVGGHIKYTNEFGEVVLEPITPYMPISDIGIGKVPEIEEALFSMDTAEKLL